MSLQQRLDEARQSLAMLERDVTEQLNGLRDRRRAPLVRLLHEVRAMRNPLNPFASQAGQDRVIDRLFQGARDKTFVDVGAYDGVTGSNTLFLESQRGWSGICIEPVEIFRTQGQARRSAPFLPFAVAATEGTATFMAVTKGYTQMSGLIENYDPDLLTRVREDSRHEEQQITVETRTLSGLLTERGLPNPEFISLDIEGGELSVLSSFPFDKHKVGAWSIENNQGTADIGEVMRANGYKLVEYCGADEIYAHNSLV